MPQEELVEVVLPLPIKSNYHYRLPEDLVGQVEPGMRVLVSFGRKKIYTGLVKSIVEFDESQYDRNKLKFIEDVLDQLPLFHQHHISLFEWMGFYYCCTMGEVFKASLPTGLKPESSLRVEMMDGIEWEDWELEEKEYLLMEALTIQPTLNFKEISDIWGISSPNQRLKAMAGRGLIKMYQQVEEKYKPKFKTYIKLSEEYSDQTNMSEALDSLSRAPAQENILMKVIQAYFQKITLPKTETLKELGASSQALKALVKKGILEEEEVQVDRMELYGYHATPQPIKFNEAQQKAVDQIEGFLKEERQKPILLHGITGSGKTHIYIHFMKKILAEGKQVLYLLPEITLTKQIIDRVQHELGHAVGIYHSRFNEHERVEIFQKVQRGEYQVVIGVRSAMFLPFADLGLIVVDEEHDHSFKQEDPAPRYNARDVSIYYGFQENIPVILGSATPSFETYFNARQSKYHLVELHQRAIKAKLPQVDIVDMRVQRKKGQINGIFSKILENAIKERLERKEQVILFQNRRGYSPYLLCETCGHVPQCINCDISLTYHKEKNHLRCHYCGYTHYQTQKCDNCNHYTLRWGGIGTEQIAESIQKTFPEAIVERMDLDTTRGKYSYQQIIQRFEKQEVDILVGTQMVSKGLDFENVTLVGVVQADHLLSFPDFRAYERAYQLLTQVSGRAGRSEKEGRVIIQSYTPDNLVLQSIQTPFPAFMKKELPGRNQLSYPPFTRLIRVEFRHRSQSFIELEAKRLEKYFRPVFRNNILGPEYALVGRMRNLYRMQFLIKVGKKLDPVKVRERLSEAIDKYYQEAPDKTLRIIINVDPM
ncbi:MAG: primosomal protein N' [Bacteroidia bacterium]|nr:primosomal protein N' [Bacteroidia bacterium]